MSGEMKHTTVGASLDSSEWAAASTHYALSQTQSDLLGFNGTNWVRFAPFFVSSLFLITGDGTTNDDTNVQTAITALGAA